MYSRNLVVILQQLRHGYCFRTCTNAHLIEITHRTNLQTKNFPLLSRSTATSTDTILLYKNTKSQTKFFRLIFLMSGVQLVFWTYLSYFAFAELRQETLCQQTEQTTTSSHKTTPISAADKETLIHADESLQAEPMKQPPKMTNAPWYSSLKWRLVISLLTLGTGVFFAFTACMYPLRVVQRMSYVRGRGGGVAIITFSPIKGTREVRADLSAIGMAGSRIAEGKGRQLGMKVKGHRMFYLLDREGEFPSPKLFDTLIGARRL